MLDPATIMRWLEAIDRGRGRDVRAMTAANMLPHVTEELVRLLRFEQPARRIAQVLARLGVAVSRSSVQRVVRRQPRRPSGGTAADGRKLQLPANDN